MSEQSDIEWTDATWNPVRGCTKISPGCKNCYAETFAERFRNVPGHAYEQGFDLRLVPENLKQPIGWIKPRRIFVNSMGDLFHEDVPFHFIRSVYHIMQYTERHTYQILTKRAERMRRFHRGHANRFQPWPLPNVWPGVSVEDRKHGFPRIEVLREIPATVRFLSIEPLLEDLGVIDLTGIGWVIVGGESGPGARPMKAEWVRNIREQCQAAKIPFFFKQWGGPRKKLTGRILDGRTYDEMPELKAA